MKRGAAIFLVALGVAQIIGDLAGFLPLKAVAAATGASPAPKVFSAVQGLETYSTRFFLETDGRRVELTPEVYSRIRGPYNRRNAYGAALAYAPVLPRELREPVMRHALCGDAPLLRELGIPRAKNVAVTLEPLPGTSLGKLQTRFDLECGDGSRRFGRAEAQRRPRAEAGASAGKAATAVAAVQK